MPGLSVPPSESPSQPLSTPALKLRAKFQSVPASQVGDALLLDAQQGETTKSIEGWLKSVELRRPT